MSNSPFQSDTTPESQIQRDLRFPAIGLIVTGGLNALLSMLMLLSGLVRLTGGGQSARIADDAERLGYIAGTIAAYGVGVLSLVVSPLVIAGGVAMLRGRGLGLARSAAILAIIPVTSCCCVVGIPAGIWAFRTLKKPEVEDYFKHNRMPPQAGPPYR